MRKNLYILFLIALCSGFAGCAKSEAADPLGGNNGWWITNPGTESGYYSSASPRLIVQGTVTNTADQPLGGIYVALPSVREPNEPDILTYNYSITDSLGKYTIIRYRGREVPMEITVVATDSTGLYPEQYIFAPVTYDTALVQNQKIPYNGYATVNFEL